jgi:hypothetical protein
MTNTEEQEMLTRLSIQERLAPVGEILERNADVAGGLWTDHARGGLTVVQLTSAASPELRAAVERAAPDARRLRIVEVTHSAEHLRGLREHIEANRGTLIDKGIAVVSLAVDVPSNTVRAGVENLNTAAEHELRKLYPQPEVRFYREAQAVPTDTVKSSPGPWKGGITVTGTGTCSMGFAVRSNSTGNLFFVTAGHCGGSSFRHLGQSHPLTRRVFGNADVDALSIDVPDGQASNLAVMSASQGARVMYRKTTQYTGDAVCKTGQTTGKACGTITNPDMSRTYDGKTTHHLVQTNFIVDQGDSGGLVFVDGYIYSGVQDVTAAGITAARSTDYMYGYYSTLANIERIFGVTAVTSLQSPVEQPRHSWLCMDVQGGSSQMAQDCSNGTATARTLKSSSSGLCTETTRSWLVTAAGASPCQGAGLTTG